MENDGSLALIKYLVEKSLPAGEIHFTQWHATVFTWVNEFGSGKTSVKNNFQCPFRGSPHDQNRQENQRNGVKSWQIEIEIIKSGISKQ